MDHQQYDILMKTSGILTEWPYPKFLSALSDRDKEILRRLLAYHQENFLGHETNAPCQWIAGRLCQWLEKTNDAIKYFTRATILDPNFANAYRELSLSFWSCWDLQSAERTARKASEINSEDYTLQFNLAFILASKGDLDEAAKTINAAKLIAPPEDAIRFLAIIDDIKCGDVPAPKDFNQALNLFG